MPRQLPQTSFRRTSAICSPTYLCPPDYIRPVVSAFFLGFTYCFLFAAACAVAHPDSASLLLWLAGQASVALGVVYGFLALTSAGVHHFVWWKLLRDHGAQAYETQLQLDMPKHHAFELSLAASAAIARGKVVNIDEDRGELRLFVKGDWFRHMDRYVDITINQASNASMVSIASYIALPEWRRRFILAIWGEKWLPVLISMNWKRHHELTEKVVDFIEHTPDWDYHHVPDRLSEALQQIDTEKTA